MSFLQREAVPALLVTLCLGGAGCRKGSEAPPAPQRAVQGQALAAAIDAGPGSVQPRPPVSKYLSAVELPAEERAALEGRLAYFFERAEGEGHIHVLGKTNEAARPLTSGPEAYFPVQVFPDGKALLAIRSSGQVETSHREQLVVLPLPAGRPRALGPASPRTRNPVLSADGTTVVFESGLKSFSDLFRIGRDGKGLLQLTDSEQGNFEPTLSPDGKQVLFVSSRDMNPELYVMNADGTDERKRLEHPAEDVTPRWSPQGQYVLFLSGREGRDRLYLLRPEGRAERIHPDRPPPPVAPQDPNDAGLEPLEQEPVWSPDGQKVAYVAREQGERTRVFLYDVTTQALEVLTSGAANADQPRFSPDGKYLAYVEDPGNNQDIYVVRLYPPAVGRVTAAPEREWLPVWLK